MSAECLVCRELRGDVAIPGRFLLEDEFVVGFHMPPLEELGNPRPYLGHLLVVTRRHAPRFGDLADDESAPVGRAAAQLARALTELGGADWVYSAVIGTGVPHFHLHLLARYPDTPREVPWYAIDEWEGSAWQCRRNRKACQEADELKSTGKLLVEVLLAQVILPRPPGLTPIRAQIRSSSSSSQRDACSDMTQRPVEEKAKTT